MSSATVIWPISVKSVPVSTTTSPVTVTAEAAVKSASLNVTAPVWLNGRLSTTAPIKMKLA